MFYEPSILQLTITQEGKHISENDVPSIVRKLVEQFERNIKQYRSSGYNESQLRNEFLNPFFEALGWDVYNKQGDAPQYRDVIFEDSIKVGGGTKAPDYCFTLAGNRMFFVEAKKPAVDIERDTKPAYQIRRYAWSSKLPLSILMNFEHFAVYESRQKPHVSDKPSKERILLISYNEYVDRWNEIASIFSYQAVRQGSFDRFAESAKKKRGTQEVDDEFLKEIEEWREKIAKNIALRNPILTVRELNISVQRTIDRILFLRMCEDRGIEKYGQFRSIAENNDIYVNLCKVFEKADEKYNSGLFHFKMEKNRDTLPDKLSLSINIDDNVIKSIFRHLYYPNSPYEFSVISPEILGNVYEQFLGKVITLTKGHRAKIEEKPEVKKAGGVYYTPEYIVDYIVDSVVGRLINGKTPKQISKIKILDPACGSGSFLIGAYSYLLKYHRDYYSSKKNPGRYKEYVYRGKNDEWNLTIKEKKRILLNNIYGVDIDNQAVEVTKLSLLLKVLEGESRDVFEKQQKLWMERVLPDLGNNIKCGNSLIGPDFYREDLQQAIFDEREMFRINIFDWNEEFKTIMSNGGFDAVIGNPPYLRIQGLQEFYGSQIDYFIRKYKSAVKRFDMYLLFAEKGFNLLNKNGFLGFILPHKFLNSDFGSGLREFLINKTALKSFVSFGNNLIFKKATTYTGIMILSKNENSKFEYYRFDNMPITQLQKKLISIPKKDFSEYNIKKLTPEPWALLSSENKRVYDKIMKIPDGLGTTFDSIFQGIVTGADDIYFLKKINNSYEENKKIVEVISQRKQGNISIERDIIKPILRGEDVQKYRKSKYQYYCIYPYKKMETKTVILQEHELKDKYPLAYDYLKNYKSELTRLRKKFKTNPKYWYSCHRGRSIIFFENERIITPEISLGCNMTCSNADIYHNTKVYSLIPPSKYNEKIHYWLGILNSNIMWWFLSTTGYVLRGGFYVFKTNYLNPFPIRTINFSKKEDVKKHDKMVSLVKKMLKLKESLELKKTEQAITVIKRQIDMVEQQINELTYELYNLNKEEIKVVESVAID